MDEEALFSPLEITAVCLLADQETTAWLLCRP
jgi:hypothetical protein